MIDLGTLVLGVKVDADKAKKDLDKTKSSFSKFGEKLKEIGKNIGTAFAKTSEIIGNIGAKAAEAVTSFYNAASEVATAADVVDKASQRMGVDAEYYQELAFAAGQSGIQMNVMEKAALQLQKAGSELSFDKALEEILSLTTAEERSAAATELFGDKVAYEMAPLLNAGAEGFAELTKQAHDYGLVMSDEVVSSGAAFNDSIALIQQSIEGLRNNIIGKFLPSLTNISTGLIGIINGVEGADEQFQKGVEDLIDKIPEVIDKLFGDDGILSSKNIMKIIDCGVKLFGKLLDKADKIAQDLCDKIPPMIEEMTGDNGVLSKENIAKMVKSGTSLFIHLVDGAVDIVLAICDALPSIIDGLLDTENGLLAPQNIAKMIQAGIKLFMGLVGDVALIIATIIANLPEIIEGIIGGILDPENLEAFKDAGMKLLNKLWDGLKLIWDSISSWFTDIWKSITGWIDGLLGKKKEAQGISDDIEAFENHAGSGNHTSSNGITHGGKSGSIDSVNNTTGSGITTAKQPTVTNPNTNGNNVVINNSFYSPKAIDESTAAKMTRQSTDMLALRW